MEDKNKYSKFMHKRASSPIQRRQQVEVTMPLLGREASLLDSARRKTWTRAKKTESIGVHCHVPYEKPVPCPPPHHTYCMSLCSLVVGTLAFLCVMSLVLHLFYYSSMPHYSSTSVWFDGRLIKSSEGGHNPVDRRERSADEVMPRIAKLYYEFSTTTDSGMYVRYPEKGGIRGLHRDGLLDYTLCCMSRRNVYVCSNGGKSMADKYGVDCVLKFEMLEDEEDDQNGLGEDEHGYLMLYVEDPVMCGCQCRLVWSAAFVDLSADFDLPVLAGAAHRDEDVSSPTVEGAEKKHNIDGYTSKHREEPDFDVEQAGRIRVD